jgi:hypothetical protein
MNYYRRAATIGLLAVCPLGLWAQTPKKPGRAASAPVVVEEQQNAEQVKDKLRQLLDNYPPSLHNILATDPTLLSNEAYLAPYPGLEAFLNEHPEIGRNPVFYLGEGLEHRQPLDREGRAMDMWREMINNFSALVGVGMGIALLVWLIRTLVDYRRWARLAKVQTDAHTKLLDRFTANEELLAYIQTPAGQNFLQSTPIKLESGPRNLSAPLGRILWSLQGGVVLMAGGLGMQAIAVQVSGELAHPFRAIGILALALGLGFVVSAALSYVLSRRLGLIDRVPQPVQE